MLLTIVTGYAGRDAKIETLQDGTNAINFSLAESYKYTDKETGEIKDKTTWIDVSYYRSPGKSTSIAEHIKKGTQLLVQGRVTASTYTNKNGKVLPVLRLYADKVELLAKPKDSSDAQPTAPELPTKPAKQTQTPPTKEPAQTEQKETPPTEQELIQKSIDDIPF